MADVEYKVAISWEVADLDAKIQTKLAALRTGPGGRVGKLDVDAGGEVSAMTGKLEALSRSAESAVGRVGEAFTGAVERAGELALHLGALGGAAAVGVLAYGVTHLNNELEQTQLSLAAIFNAQGYSHDFEGGMRIAADQVAKMKTDVKSLPGDLGQLSAIMKTIATPAAQAGATPDQIRSLAGRSMLVGQILGVDQATTAREMAQLLAGRAGAHNILGTRLGFVGASAKHLNAESPAARMKDVTAELAKFDASAEAFGHSWVSIFTTFKDDIKYSLLAPASSPLFESVKHTMEQSHAWFSENEMGVAKWSALIGHGVADAFAEGKKEIALWEPPIERFAENAYAKISNVWRRLGPEIGEVGEKVRAALADPHSIDTIEKVLKLYAETKGAQIALPYAKDAFGLGKGIFGLVGGGGGGGGGATGEAGKLSSIAEKALADQAALYKKSGSIQDAALLASMTQASEEVGGGLGAVVATGGAAAFALLAVAGALDSVNSKSAAFHDQSSALWQDIKEQSGETGKSVTGIVPALRWLADGIGFVGLASLDAAARLQNLGTNIGVAIGNWIAALTGGSGLHEGTHLGRVLDASAKGLATKLADHLGNDFKDTLSPRTASALVGAGAGGGAGTHIGTQNNYFTVSSNAEPSRVARTIKNAIAEKSRYPTSSPYVPNFSASRPRFI